MSNDSKPHIAVRTTVTISLSDDTCAVIGLYGEDTVASKLAKQPLYCTYKTYRRTSGPNVPGVLMSYGEDVYKQCRIIDIASSGSEAYGFLLEDINESDDNAKRFIANASTCTNIRSQQTSAPKWTSKFKALIEKFTARSSVALTETSSGLGLDSLDEVEIVIALEDAYKLEIPDSHAANWKTVGDIVTYLTGLNIKVIDDAP